MSGTAVLIAVMLVITVLAALNLARPLWTRRDPQAAQRRASNIAAYRQRLIEIDQELAAGLIPADQAQAVRDEAGARLLDDVDHRDLPASPVGNRPVPPRRRAAVLLLLVVAVFSAGYYYSQGTWQQQRLVAGEVQPPPVTAEDVEQMLATLRARLDSAPDDAEGWAMLGRAYFMTRRYPESAQAYAQVNRITQSRNPDALTGEAEALAMAGNRELSGRPRELFEQALALEPQQPKALWYGGLAAAQAGDTALARQRWTALLQQPLPDELRTVLTEQLAAIDGSAPALTAAPAISPPSATPPAVRLRVQLLLAQGMLAQVPADAVLMVFARAEQGPPMPVAVYRGAATPLPSEVILDDSMAVMPTMKLSQFDRWIVTARIGRTGQAKAESGDLQGSVVVGRDQAGEPLTLTIDQRIP
ncbi:cytochrome c-type biogenesis protein CcmH [Hydrocarboniphaga daqingensis]|uniref:Cytochrome c-type biogenesis protein CcmH n=1 Tax=Hydrocarboniphaga daqingensis TaxID=490188 RepID=A0A1M5RSM9_9GAMM|nr:c-type cytochrome biogenesis protein CcmI [Hydrocarboniphaga daqingensis]SHH29190.1 cytochrome c-type biogenesis protein CcmH [Hydrocarboniphaga daqingensis]